MRLTRMVVVAGVTVATVGFGACKSASELGGSGGSGRNVETQQETGGSSGMYGPGNAPSFGGADAGIGGGGTFGAADAGVGGGGTFGAEDAGVGGSGSLGSDAGMGGSGLDFGTGSGGTGR